MVFRWRRPLLLTYNDNYKYGTSLYSGTVGDVEKKYRDSLSRTQLRSDRGDLGLSTFSGSHLHGGLAAGSTGSTGTSGTTGVTSIPSNITTKQPERDLYAPLSFGYGRSYYNTLKGNSEPGNTKGKESTTKSSYLSSSEEVSKDIKTTTSSKTTTSDYDNVKKTVTTTTTSEKWVPLSQYLYPSSTTYYYYTSPYTSKTSDMYFLDEMKQKTSSKSKIDDLDLKVSSSSATSYDKFDYNFWTDKCHDIQSQLDHVNHWVADAESKIKGDVVGARNKMQAELADVTLLVDDTTKYNEELQRVIKRQAKQISQLHSQYDEINRYLVDVSDNLEKSRLRCQSLQADLSNVQSGLEMASKRRL